MYNVHIVTVTNRKLLRRVFENRERRTSRAARAAAAEANGMRKGRPGKRNRRRRRHRAPTVVRSARVFIIKSFCRAAAAAVVMRSSVVGRVGRGGVCTYSRGGEARSSLHARRCSSSRPRGGKRGVGVAAAGSIGPWPW